MKRTAAFDEWGERERLRRWWRTKEALVSTQSSTTTTRPPSCPTAWSSRVDGPPSSIIFFLSLFCFLSLLSSVELGFILGWSNAGNVDVWINARAALVTQIFLRFRFLTPKKKPHIWKWPQVLSLWKLNQVGKISWKVLQMKSFILYFRSCSTICIKERDCHRGANTNLFNPNEYYTLRWNHNCWCEISL